LTAQILSGGDVAARVRAEVAERVADLVGHGGVPPGLATVLVGDDQASQIYVRNKHRAAQSVGMASFDHHLPETASQDDVEALIRRLNDDPAVSGMILQLPLPSGLDGEAAVAEISPMKDADGLHPFNLGLLVLDRPAPRPATPSGILRILHHYGIETEGRVAVVVGRSFLVGRPLALMLGSKEVNATVVQAHSRTADLAALCRRADILVTAVGRARMFGADFVGDGAVVIDVGTNRTEKGLVGDVDFDAVKDVAAAITPVPGGVGPMTIASLLANTVSLAESAAE
jgi:methylenetetrahydrofolate dehydrogenase (NADP+)/methenyltetrahydrofolate cyclohydrolase